MRTYRLYGNIHSTLYRVDTDGECQMYHVGKGWGACLAGEGAIIRYCALLVKNVVFK